MSRVLPTFLSLAVQMEGWVQGLGTGAQRWEAWEQDHRCGRPGNRTKGGGSGNRTKGGGSGNRTIGGDLGTGPNVRGLGMGLKILAATIFDSSADGIQSYDPVNRVVTWNVRIIYLHVYLCPILGLQPASSWAGPGNEAAV